MYTLLISYLLMSRYWMEYDEMRIFGMCLGWNAAGSNYGETVFGMYTVKLDDLLIRIRICLNLSVGFVNYFSFGLVSIVKRSWIILTIAFSIYLDVETSSFHHEIFNLPHIIYINYVKVFDSSDFFNLLVGNIYSLLIYYLI